MVIGGSSKMRTTSSRLNRGAARADKKGPTELIDEPAFADKLDRVSTKLEDTNNKLDRIFHLLEKKLTDIERAISDRAK
jgi:hypothetical protein